MSGTNVALTSLTLEEIGGRMAVKDATAGGQTENYIFQQFSTFSFLSKWDNLTYKARSCFDSIQEKKTRLKLKKPPHTPQKKEKRGVGGGQELEHCSPTTRLRAENHRFRDFFLWRETTLNSFVKVHSIINRLVSTCQYVLKILQATQHEAFSTQEMKNTLRSFAARISDFFEAFFLTVNWACWVT